MAPEQTNYPFLLKTCLTKESRNAFWQSTPLTLGSAWTISLAFIPKLGWNIQVEICLYILYFKSKDGFRSLMSTFGSENHFSHPWFSIQAENSLYSLNIKSSSNVFCFFSSNVFFFQNCKH